MAGAEKIKERILEEARRQAQENIEKAEKEAEEIIETAQKEATEKKTEIIEKAKIEAVNREQRLIAVAELEARKEKLKAKQAMIEEAFQKTLEKLNNLETEEYEAVLADMVVGSVTNGNEEIIVSEKDRQRLSAGLIKKSNKALKAKGLDGSVKLSEETRPISGGFILKLGDVEVNNSFETIMRMQREELELEVVKALF
ncbi:MAG: hypothetical protein MJB12_19485 [Firmicutes bacterium]|nr:hypothetical protein [Bacillota bacterium]